jgi:hypothetical protein
MKLHKLTVKMLNRRGYYVNPDGITVRRKNGAKMMIETAMILCRKKLMAEKQARYAKAHPEKMRAIEKKSRKKARKKLVDPSVVTG